jgi:LysW-gamma-L-lysine carboxypeptidase
MKTKNDLEKLLINLIEIESVSGNEKKIADFICRQLTGFSITKQIISKNRYNIYAQKGKSDIWLVAHMDTVVGKVPIKITDKSIYGRGAVDNKGNIAGAITVAKNLENINLLFTVGEEVDFAGAKKAKINGKVIILEPTSLRVKLNQRGVIVFRINTFGIQQHSSLPFNEKDNANHQMIRILNKILDFSWSNFNIGALSGGNATNIISDSSTIECSVRPKNDTEYTEIMDTLKSLSKNTKIQIVNSVPPYTSSLRVENADTESVAFFSELGFFKNGVLFGVGDDKQSHTKHEHIERSELNKFPKKLIQLINEIKK